MTKTLIAFLLLFISATTFSEEADIPFKINQDTAYKLAGLAYGKPKLTKYMSYDGLSKIGPTFFNYDGINPPGYEGSFGFFAVNPWTGDVWALWGCHKISTPASLKIQAKIKKRFNAEESKQYNQLSQLKPDCVVDDKDIEQ